MNGRMYSVYSRRDGTQLASRLTNAATEPRKSSIGSSRRVQTLGGVLETLGVRIRAEQPGGAVGMTVEALRPSKHSCA